MTTYKFPHNFLCGAAAVLDLTGHDGRKYSAQEIHDITRRP